jgi:hypothetical protein
MSTIRGTIQDGKVVFDTPPDVPNGTPVTVNFSPWAGTDDLPDDDDQSPEAIARRLALMDRVQQWLTPEEQAAWEKARAEDKAFQLSQWDKWCKEVGGIFE